MHSEGASRGSAARPSDASALAQVVAIQMACVNFLTWIWNFYDSQPACMYRIQLERRMRARSNTCQLSPGRPTPPDLRRPGKQVRRALVIPGCLLVAGQQTAAH